jgi:hypothetical protein
MEDLSRLAGAENASEEPAKQEPLQTPPLPFLACRVHTILDGVQSIFAIRFFDKMAGHYESCDNAAVAYWALGYQLVCQ